jgi:pyridoxamine 5'-phosphate oxidase
VAVATATPDGFPSLRMVLLKDHGPHLLGPLGGFVFYTNAHSRKGGELLANPQAAMLFHWKACAARSASRAPSQQVPDAMADAYFASRSRDRNWARWPATSRAAASRAHFLADIARVTARHLIGPCRARRTGPAFA